MDPALQELILVGHPDQEVEAIIRLRQPDQLPSDVRLISRFGHIATVRLARKNIQNVWANKKVLSLKAPRFVGLDIYRSEEEQNANDQEFPMKEGRPNIPFTGNQVVVGIIDWGFDFTHPNFLQPDGTSRFEAIWDQTGEAANSYYGYGTIHLQTEINQALRAKRPFESLGYHPAQGDPLGNGAHGTHVLDIAAGSGVVGKKGMAPEAILMAVHLSAGRQHPTATLGDSVRILEAIDFLHQQAGDRPLVINISVGKHGGPHNGSTLVEQGMDQFLILNPSRAIVQSTGNYFQAQIHAAGHLQAGERKSLNWQVEKVDYTYNELELFYSGKDELGLKLLSPTGRPGITCPLGDRMDIILDEQTVGRIYHRQTEPNSGYHHIDIFLYPEAPPGTWELQIEGRQINSQKGWYHAWIERDAGCASCQSRFDASTANPLQTTGTICNGRETIVVGAYQTNAEIFQLAPFSSAGPTLDGRRKPSILAPGTQITAARSTPLDENRSQGELTKKSGTSMAAPKLTGAVALLMQSLPQETKSSTYRELLESMTTLPYMKDTFSKYRMGAGIFDLGSFYYQLARMAHQPESPPIADLENTNIMKHQANCTCTACSQNVPNQALPNAADLLQLVPVNIFDDVLINPAQAAATLQEQQLRVIAYPGTILEERILPNDILITRVLGEGKLSFKRLAKNGIRFLEEKRIPLAPPQFLPPDSKRIPTDTLILRHLPSADSTLAGLLMPLLQFKPQAQKGKPLAEIPTLPKLPIRQNEKASSFRPPFLDKIFEVNDNFAILRSANFKPILATQAPFPSTAIRSGKLILVKGTKVKVSAVKFYQGDLYLYTMLPTSPSTPYGWTSAANVKGNFLNEILRVRKAPLPLGSQDGDKWTVSNWFSLLRDPKRNFQAIQQIIPPNSKVLVKQLDQKRGMALVQQVTKIVNAQQFTPGQIIGWTRADNLSLGWTDIFSPFAAWKAGPLLPTQYLNVDGIQYCGSRKRSRMPTYIGQHDLVDLVGIKRTRYTLYQALNNDSLSPFLQMTKQALADDIAIALTSGFRSFSSQQRLYNCYCQKKPGCNLAAYPGTSNHQNGIAYDLAVQYRKGNKGIGTGSVYEWLRQNATEFGFVRTVRSEAWHWEYRPNEAKLLRQKSDHRLWKLQKPN